MEKQLNFTDIEYSNRRRITQKEAFLTKMDSIIPWEEFVELVKPFYPDGKRGRKPIEIETMLRMTMLQVWFSVSDDGLEDAIYDSYCMKAFLGLNFEDNQVPDATTLCKFRKLLNENHLQKKIFNQVQEILKRKGLQVKGGTIVDATIIEASSCKKNKDNSTDPEMHSVRKGHNYYFGMRLHIGTDPLHGFVHTAVVTPANAPEVQVAPQLLRQDDVSIYGDAGYCGLAKYDSLHAQREYHICRQRGTFKRHYGNSIAWSEETKLESRKASMRCKVEYVFHVIKDIFKWRRARYKGIQKNAAYANLALASANLYMLAACRI